MGVNYGICFNLSKHIKQMPKTTPRETAARYTLHLNYQAVINLRLQIYHANNDFDEEFDALCESCEAQKGFEEHLICIRMAQERTARWVASSVSQHATNVTIKKIH